MATVTILAAIVLHSIGVIVRSDFTPKGVTVNDNSAMMQVHVGLKKQFAVVDQKPDAEDTKAAEVAEIKNVTATVKALSANISKAMARYMAAEVAESKNVSKQVSEVADQYEAAIQKLVANISKSIGNEAPGAHVDVENLLKQVNKTAENWTAALKVFAANISEFVTKDMRSHNASKPEIAEVVKDINQIATGGRALIKEIAARTREANGTEADENQAEATLFVIALNATADYLDSKIKDWASTIKGALNTTAELENYTSLSSQMQ